MNFLEEILAIKKEESARLHRDFTISRFKDSKFYEIPRISFSEEVKSNSDISIIAEIKKASPSKGILIDNFDYKMIAETYMEFGANAISVLTDEIFFKGNIKYLREIAEFKNKPILRKDFIVDEFQIYEAKSNGADIILLIAEALSEQQIKELSQCALENDMEVLLETHSIEQLSKIDFNINKIIGVNNRNLKTFNVDINTTIEVKEKLPKDLILISESGISKYEDIQKLKQAKINGTLVGEMLMKAENIKKSLQELKKWCQNEN